MSNSDAKPEDNSSPTDNPTEDKSVDAKIDALDDEAAKQRLGISSGGLDKKKSIIFGIVGLVFLVIVFFRVIPQIGDYAQAAESIKSMTLASLVGLIAAVLIYLFIYGWPFVASTPGLRYKSGFIINQSAFAVSNGVPAGGAIGLGLQYAQLTSYKATPTVATASIGATGIWSVFVTLFLPVTGVVALTLSGDSAGDYVLGAVIGVIVLVAVVGIFALILRSEPAALKVGRVADAVVNKTIRVFKKDFSADITAAIVQLRGDIVELVSKRWAWITLAQIAVSWSQFGILYMALSGVSGDSGPAPILVAYGCWSIAQLGMMIPITPGGLGTVDAAMISLMITMGIDVGVATAAALVWRASSYIPQIIIGVACIFYWRFDISRQQKKELAA